MKVNGREILLRRKFIRQVDSAADYLRKMGNQKAEDFVDGLEELIFEKIPNFPFSHPEFDKKPTPEKIYRRAIFKQNWKVVYAVSETTIVYIFFYHSSRDIDSLEIWRIILKEDKGRCQEFMGYDLTELILNNSLVFIFQK